MELTKIAAKPVLVKVVLESEEIVKEYGEPIEFYTWDRQPIDVFMRLANVDRNDFTQVLDIIKTLILDKSGKAVIKDDVTLPGSILMAAVNKIVELLGK